MKKNKLIDSLLESDIIVSEDEIKALASLSNKCEANIYEIIEKGRYSLNITYDDGSDQILIATNNIEKYTDEVRNFYALFVKHGGNIIIDDVFLMNNTGINFDKSLALKNFIDKKTKDTTFN